MEGDLLGGVSDFSEMILTLVTLVSSKTSFFFLSLFGKLNFMVSSIGALQVFEELVKG
jgi:hypothetical protein